LRSLIAQFQTAWDARDAAALAPLLADDIVFHTPAAGHPVVGKDQVLSVLDMLSKIVEELAYVSEYTNNEGVVLLSTGRIGGKRADAIQVVTLNEDDLITQFQDFVRPLSALTALSAAAAEYMARQDPSA
jgi:nucleoside-diphosphate-sugar epimerase